MGIWAAFANRAHALPAPIVAGLVQGLLTAFITLTVKKLIDALFGRLKGRRYASLLVPPLISAGLVLAILVGVHTFVGTPEIAATIAVPWGMSFFYTSGYAFSLWRGTIDA